MALSRTNLVILLLLVLGGTYIWFYERHQLSTDDLRAGERQVLAGVETTDVKQVFLVAGDTVWALQRTGDGMMSGWELAAPLRDEADPVAVDRFLSALLGAPAQPAGDADDSAVQAAFGTVRATIRLVLTSGAEREISIGAPDAFTRGVFVRVTGEPRVKTATLGPEVLAVATADLRRRDLLGALAYRTNRFVVDDAVELRERDGNWQMLRPAPLLVRNAQMTRLVSSLATAPVLTFTETAPADGATLALCAGDTVLTVLRCNRPAPGDATVHASLSTRPGGFVIPAELVRPFFGGAASFAALTLAPAGVYDLQGLSWSGSDSGTLRRAEGGEWPAGSADLLEPLLNLPLTGYAVSAAPQPPRPVAQAEVTITLQRYEGPAQQLFLWREGGRYLVWREGEAATSHVDATKLRSLLAALR